MNKKHFFSAPALLLLLVNALHAQVTLPSLVSDSMVLQRNIPLKIWGWASPGEAVAVSFNKKTYKTVTRPDGKWDVMLPAMKEGGPYEMTVKGRNEITIKEILVGDVWLASGQSNMEFPMSRLQQKYPEDIASSASYPIREFHVKERYSFTPEEKTEGSWKPANPVNILRFSAVAYFFAQKLYGTYKVPIGILHSSWPGTPAESWISIDSLAAFPEYVKVARQFSQAGFADSLANAEKAQAMSWHRTVRNNDAGMTGQWARQPADSSWKKIIIPGFWQNQGAKDVHGAVWLKQTVQVPPGFANGNIYLELGLIDDADSTYINGQFVGTTDNRYGVRRYSIPSSFLKEGNNDITIRVLDLDGDGGIIPGKTYRLTNGKDAIAIAGEWRYKIGYATGNMPAQTRIAYKPVLVYNGLIEPILNYRIKGAIWYQGEGNTGYAKSREYRRLLPVMIHEWRAKWQQGDFPFLIVQLANYMPAKPQPAESNWAMLRESQQIVARNEPHCGLAVAIDIGEAGDIHPPNKKDVGYRLALQADEIAYHDTRVHASGPVYRSMQIQGNKIILSFTDVRGGLTAKDGTRLQQFAIAGEDKVFYWADAVIEGDKVVVSSDAFKNPVAVRYAWADNPAGCNLYNKDGLPAVPFRTDSWEK
ncbi:MAG: sialate O-acetylesterase [Bacteroidetes bacterium]|nr:sialate O-acetylesterase [Bacteroidota bacterium]